MARVPVALLGVGNVGKSVLRSLLHNASLHEASFNLRFDVIAASDSTGFIARPASFGSQTSFIDSIIAWKNEKKGFSDHPHGSAQLASMFSGLPENAVVIDCTASSSTSEHIVSHLKRGGKVVLANKKPLSQDLALFQEIVKHASRVRFESTCGAGTPFITTVQRLISAGDNISSMSGCFSGTLGFITTQMSASTTMSDLLHKAIAAGYTEPDPRDDLSGIDVARKALILARLCGAKLELEDVRVEPLYPPVLSKCSVEEFVRRYGSECDAVYAQRVKEAEARGCVLRYVAQVTATQCTVGLQEVPYSAPLGLLKGTDNILQVSSKFYPKAPLVVQGAGAGADITAMGVVADLVSVATVA